jgi:hypothetical protein
VTRFAFRDAIEDFRSVSGEVLVRVYGTCDGGEPFEVLVTPTDALAMSGVLKKVATEILETRAAVDTGP